MSLDTLDNLKLEIIDWSHRDDIDLKVDTFIDLAESQMFANQLEPLRLLSEDTLVTDTLDSTTPSRFLALPAGFQSMRKLRIQIENGESVELQFRTPSQLRIINRAGLPCFFTVTSQLEFDRDPDIDYSVRIQYFKDFTPLSDANPTNQVLTDHPDIYLWGSLWALNNWAEQEVVAARYFQQFISAIKGANLKAEMGRYGPAPVMRVEGFTP
jgi:hypothetical protein